MFITRAEKLPTDYLFPDAFALLFSATGLQPLTGVVSFDWRGPAGSVYAIRICTDAARTQIVTGTDSEPMQQGNLTATSHTFNYDVTNGAQRYGRIDRWPNNSLIEADREQLDFQYTAHNGVAKVISTSGWTLLTFPSANLAYGQYNQSRHNEMMDPATQWFIDGAADVAVETTSYGRALTARLASTNNQITSAAYIPQVTGQGRVRLAFKMRLREGFSFGNASSANRVLLGFGLRSTVDASEGEPVDDGWSIRWAIKRAANGSPIFMLYGYTGKSVVTGSEFQAMFNGSTYPVVVGDAYQLVIDITLNSPGDENGLMKAHINADQVINTTQMRYQNTGTPDVRGISFTNACLIAPTTTSYVEFFDIAYKIG